MIEYIIIAAVWLLSFVLLGFIPRHKRRLGLIAFFVKQWVTCVLGHLVVQLHLLAYPVREFAEINRSSLTYEFMAYPTVCALFTACYPVGKSKWIQFGYYALFCTALTVPEVLLERYTQVVRYIHWNGLWTWSTLFLTFLLTRMICVYYFQTIDISASDRTADSR